MAQDILKFLSVPLRNIGGIFLRRRFEGSCIFPSKGVKFVLALAILIYLPGYSKMRELKEREGALKKEIAKAEEMKAGLLAEREALKYDPVYAERVAREDMKFAGKREIIYKVE